MKSLLGLAGRVAVLAVALVGVLPAAGHAGEAQVRFHQGLISATFEATLIPEVVDVIHRATGVEVVLPSLVLGRTLTLTLKEASFERLLQRVLEALDLGGFALVYDPRDASSRVIVVEKARGDEAPSAPVAPARTRGGAERRFVPFLMPKTEADAIGLGASGQVIVVQAAPFAKTKTRECDGTGAEYPVQTVLLMDETNTYITSIVVCATDGLNPGQKLIPAPPSTEVGVPVEAGLTYSKHGATAE